MSDVAILDKVVGERAGAGQDPRKRRQILEGARRLFLSRGFDGGSMGEVAAEAGVSKGTLYVYFDSKEELFTALVHEEKQRQFPQIFALDADDPDVQAALIRVGGRFARFISSPEVLMAMRTVIGIAERMPQLGADFFEKGPRLCAARVAEYLDHQVSAGQLAIPDTTLAAVQFLDLVQSTITRPLLFGVAERPSEEQIDAVVASAVRVFMAAYGARAG